MTPAERYAAYTAVIRDINTIRKTAPSKYVDKWIRKAMDAMHTAYGAEIGFGSVEIPESEEKP